MKFFVNDANSQVSCGRHVVYWKKPWTISKKVHIRSSNLHLQFYSFENEFNKPKIWKDYFKTFRLNLKSENNKLKIKK